MIIALHVLIAVGSIAFTSYSYFFPTRSRLKVSQGLVIATLASGTFLVISTHANMISACITGLIYLAGVSVAIFLASRRLAAQSSQK